MADISPRPLVSVVIATWNRGNDLRETLRKYSCQTYSNIEIIVVDNGSTDGTDKIVSSEFPGVRYVRLDENTGVKGYNIGMQASQGEIVVVSDNDSYLEETGVQKIVDAFHRMPENVGVISCEIIYVPGNQVYRWHTGEIGDGKAPNGYPTYMFIGAGAAIKRSVLDKVGYYPEEFFLYMNEVDLCTRILGAGYDIRYFPDVKAYHKVSQVSKSKDMRMLLSFRNIIWYYWKYFPYPTAIGRSVLRTGIELVHLAVSGTKPRLIMSYTVETFAALPGIIRNRRPIPRKQVKRALGYRSEIAGYIEYVRDVLSRRSTKRTKQVG